MSVIPAIWETELGGACLEASLGKKVSETLFQQNEQSVVTVDYSCSYSGDGDRRIAV
jgi:hypothetical protein